MAVTQQLVRIDESKLILYGSDRSAFEQLVSFESESADCYEDLNWSPSGLLVGIENILGDSVAKVVERVLSDDTRKLNAEYNHGIDDYLVESDVTYVTYDEYKDIVPMLFAVSSVTVARNIVEAYSGAELEEQTDPISDYAYNFRLLADFLNASAINRQAVVSWWD